MIIADVVGGPFILVFGLVAGVLSLLPVILIETVVLWLFKLVSFPIALRDSFLVNFVSAIAGLALALAGFIPDFRELGYLAWLTLCALSVAVEGGLLLLLHPALGRRVWLPAVVMNVVSYGCVAITVFLVGLQ